MCVWASWRLCCAATEDSQQEEQKQGTSEAESGRVAKGERREEEGDPCELNTGLLKLKTGKGWGREEDVSLAVYGKMIRDEGLGEVRNRSGIEAG